MTSYKISTVQVPWDSIWVNLLRFIPQLLLREMMESSVPSALKSLYFHLLFLLTSQLLELSPELSSQLICFLDTFWFRFLYWKCAFILKREASRAEWLQIVWRGRWKAPLKTYPKSTLAFLMPSCTSDIFCSILSPVSPDKSFSRLSNIWRA